MKIVYLKETDETCDIIKIIILRIKLFFNMIKIENVNDKKIYYLPVFSDDKISKHIIERLSKKIVKKLEEDGVVNITLSNYLETIEQLKISLYSKNINILNGRYLFKCLTYEVIGYILKRKKTAIQVAEISLLINDYTDLNIEIIKFIAKNIKKLNVITNHIDKCKPLEEYLYKEFGIMLNVSNNKRNSLIKSKIIINFDFPEELINQYKIYDNAIIVNIMNKIYIKSKKFNGININYFKISIPTKLQIKNFKNEIIYESLIYKNKDFYNIKEQIAKDKIKIKKLIGNNGYIRENEII